jgi:hypothetical protein
MDTMSSEVSSVSKRSMRLRATRSRSEITEVFEFPTSSQKFTIRATLRAAGESAMVVSVWFIRVNETETVRRLVTAYPGGRE